MAKCWKYKSNKFEAIIKAEAVKEFWERLKAQNTMDERIISVKSGDELIEEMAGKNSYERSE